jgi:hypothetical protein
MLITSEAIEKGSYISKAFNIIVNKISTKVSDEFADKFF